MVLKGQLEKSGGPIHGHDESGCVSWSTSLGERGRGYIWTVAVEEAGNAGVGKRE